MAEPSSKRARTDAVDNPYLAHHNQPAQRMTGGKGGNPFDGWIARKVDGPQVENAMVRPALFP
jgi:pre-mRNA-splicing factor ATP-dependent RNA helicase DHX15/PRP43